MNNKPLRFLVLIIAIFFIVISGLCIKNDNPNMPLIVAMMIVFLIVFVFVIGIVFLVWLIEYLEKL